MGLHYSLIRRGKLLDSIQNKNEPLKKETCFLYNHPVSFDLISNLFLFADLQITCFRKGLKGFFLLVIFKWGDDIDGYILIPMAPLMCLSPFFH